MAAAQIAAAMIKWPELPRFEWLSLLPAIYLAIAVHEVGHLVAGRLAGMKPSGILVGGLLLERSGERWIVRFSPEYLFGGLAKPVPVPGDYRRSRFAWMVAGGSIANLAVAAIAAAAIWGTDSASRAPAWIGSTFYAFLFAGSLALLPTPAGINRSDGARLWQLLAKPEQARAWMALLALQGEEAAGQLPREWSEELVQEACTADASRPEYAYTELLAFYRLIDQHRTDTALPRLENALKHSGNSGKAVRHCLFLEAAAASADVRKRPEQARTWLKRAAAIKKIANWDCAQAGIAQAEGRYADALQHLQAARDYLNRHSSQSGLIRFANEQIAHAEAECTKALTVISVENLNGSDTPGAR